MRILIADDAGFIRDLLSRVCIQSGHEIVAEAKTGREAIDESMRTNPDLIIMDLVMPDMNGFEAAKNIHEKFPHIQILACSSLESQQIKDQAISAGCYYFLQKPFTKEEAIQALEFSKQYEGVLKHG